MLAKRLNIDALCTWAEALCRRIAARDLGNKPLYVVAQSRVPAEFGGAADCSGFTTPNLDLYLRDTIATAWRGRGPCMVVNDNDLTETMDAADIESAIAATALHELAHIVQRPALFRDRQNQDPDKLVYEALCVGHIVATEPGPDSAAATAKPYYGHEAGFIRIALHLRRRAELVGVLIPLFGYAAGNLYGLSHPSRYVESLADEPDRLIAASFKEIVSTPYPEEFSRLWAADMARWRFDGSPF